MAIRINYDDDLTRATQTDPSGLPWEGYNEWNATREERRARAEREDPGSTTKRDLLWAGKTKAPVALGGEPEGEGGGGEGTPTIPGPAASGAGSQKALPGWQQYQVPQAQTSAEERALWESIMGGITDAMSGKLAPFNEDTMARIRARLFQDTRGQAAASKESLNRDLVRRGLTRSGIAAEGGMAIERGASADYSKQVRESLVIAAQENFKAKSQALSFAAEQLKASQQFRLSNARNGQEYAIAQAQMDLSWARLRQEWNALQASLANAIRLAEMGSESDLTIAMLSGTAGAGTGGYYY